MVLNQDRQVDESVLEEIQQRPEMPIIWLKESHDKRWWKQ